MFAAADEVSAIVVDIGTSSIRAGYAGDDTPKCVIPTSYGYTLDPNEPGDVAMEGAETENGEQKTGLSSSNAKLHIGQNGPSLYRRGMEVRNPMQGGLSKFNDSICASSDPTIGRQSMILLPFHLFCSTHWSTTYE